jgi:hypothetical protein
MHRVKLHEASHPLLVKAHLLLLLLLLLRDVCCHAPHEMRLGQGNRVRSASVSPAIAAPAVLHMLATRAALLLLGAPLLRGC